MAAFTSEQKYGYFDGEHIGNWSSQFPVFARVVNGNVYAVGREDNSANTDRFGKMFFLSRSWLKGAMFNGSPSDADLFLDKPNQTEDTSMPGNMFNKTSDTSQVISRPDTTATTTNPTTTTPPTTTTDPTKPVTTTDPTKTTTNTSGGTIIQSLTDSANNLGTVTKKMSSTTLILIAVAALGAVAAIIYFVKKK